MIAQVDVFAWQVCSVYMSTQWLIKAIDNVTGLNGESHIRTKKCIYRYMRGWGYRQMQYYFKQHTAVQNNHTDTIKQI